jgi:hypothetical protein
MDVNTEIVGEETVTEAPVEEAAPVVEEEEIVEDPLAGLEPPTPQYEPQVNTAEMFREEIKNTIAETLKGFAQSKEVANQPPADPVKGLEAKLEQLQYQIESMTQRAAISQEVKQSQGILNTYVNNITSSLEKAGVTTESDPMLYKAMNAELTAAVTMAERQLQRPLKPNETYQLLKNFQTEWEPALVQRGVGKTRSTTTTVTPGNTQFNNPVVNRSTNLSQEAVVKQINETDDLDALIKMGIRPTVQ